MEHKIERMRNELQKRIRLLEVLVVGAAVLLVMVAAHIIPMRYQDQNIREFLAGFQMGILLLL